MERTRSAIFVFFISLKSKEIFPGGAISSHAWLAIFIYILRFCENITVKNHSNDIFLTTINNLKRFGKKNYKFYLINTIFLQPCIAWEFPSITKEVTSRKRNMCKTDLFYQNKQHHQLFLEIFSQVFEKQHKTRSFESSFWCTFECFKGCTFESYGYSKHISRWFL